MATFEHQSFSIFFHGQLPDQGKNESNKSDFNEGKTSEKDRVSPEKKTTNKVLL